MKEGSVWLQSQRKALKRLLILLLVGDVFYFLLFCAKLLMQTQDERHQLLHD
jgi:hypothetical protein